MGRGEMYTPDSFVKIGDGRGLIFIEYADGTTIIRGECYECHEDTELFCGDEHLVCKKCLGD